MPRKKPVCHICDGRATLDPCEGGRCPACLGTTRYVEDSYTPPSVTPCHVCNETGTVSGPVICFQCSGTGFDRYG